MPGSIHENVLFTAAFFILVCTHGYPSPLRDLHYKLDNDIISQYKTATLSLTFQRRYIFFTSST